MPYPFTEDDKMYEVIRTDYHLLNMMSRFGISLGFGEKTIGEVCEMENVDTTTFLIIVNYLRGIRDTGNYIYEQLSVSTLITYLENAHTFFLDFQLPYIRRRVIEVVDCSSENKIGMLIIKFFDEYIAAVRKHMLQENTKVFPYVKKLLHGERVEAYDMAIFSKGHDMIESKLKELKNIIVKYYKTDTDVNQLNSVLFDIYNCEDDLRAHEEIEDNLFVPAVRHLEKTVGNLSGTDSNKTKQDEEQLSAREKEIVQCIVRGMTNKEVAEELFISLNTVLTHRKNIARKLSIHSVAGLTIYAIVNDLVKIEDIKVGK